MFWNGDSQSLRISWITAGSPSRELLYNSVLKGRAQKIHFSIDFRRFFWAYKSRFRILLPESEFDQLFQLLMTDFTLPCALSTITGSFTSAQISAAYTCHKLKEIQKNREIMNI